MIEILSMTQFYKTLIKKYFYTEIKKIIMKYISLEKILFIQN